MAASPPAPPAAPAGTLAAFQEAAGREVTGTAEPERRVALANRGQDWIAGNGSGVAPGRGGDLGPSAADLARAKTAAAIAAYREQAGLLARTEASASPRVGAGVDLAAPGLRRQLVDALA